MRVGESWRELAGDEGGFRQDHGLARCLYEFVVRAGLASRRGGAQWVQHYRLDSERNWLPDLDQLKKLVTPRVVACVIMLFFLTIISDLCGLFGGWLAAHFLLHLDSHQYWTNAYQSLVFADVTIGLVNPILFGFIVGTVGCYYGMTARGGTQGVGRATTQAMVASSVLILVVNYFVAQLLLFLL